MPRAKTFEKDVVLSKAMELYWDKGYYATSVQDLVSHLGINRASLYATFGNKKQLFFQSLELYCSTNKKSTLQFLENQKNIKEGFKKLFEATIKDSINDKKNKGCFVVNSTTELVPKDNQLMRSLLNNKKSFEQIFYQSLKRGQENGEIPKGKDIKTIASIIYTFFSGIMIIAKIDPNQEELLKTVTSVPTLKFQTKISHCIFD